MLSRTTNVSFFSNRNIVTPSSNAFSTSSGFSKSLRPDTPKTSSIEQRPVLPRQRSSSLDDLYVSLPSSSTGLRGFGDEFSLNHDGTTSGDHHHLHHHLSQQGFTRDWRSSDLNRSNGALRQPTKTKSAAGGLRARGEAIGKTVLRGLAQAFPIQTTETAIVDENLSNPSQHYFSTSFAERQGGGGGGGGINLSNYSRPPPVSLAGSSRYLLARSMPPTKLQSFLASLFLAGLPNIISNI